MADGEQCRQRQAEAEQDDGEGQQALSGDAQAGGEDSRLLDGAYILRARIRSGVYGNRPLPSETQLAADFATSRNIVRDGTVRIHGE
ncbi:GntR family transcriptional regulator [Nocardia sp. CC201C]|uniref:GntR family transcriptional regulator n=1 Tax=Nocardia sp. CC201C TaxID=3044575 RepID=UPI0024A7D6EE|nr:GntR family transcriptional regulator [Nocardia sp. CC201C]